MGGGSTIYVPISALTGKGVDELLEMVLLQAEMQELKANPNRLGGWQCYRGPPR